MMKIVGRVLIISFVFVLFGSAMVAAVNLIGMNLPNFNGSGRSEFRPPTAQENRPAPPVEGERERGEFGGFRWIFGVGKNVFVIAILVMMIVWPKSILRNRRRRGA